MKIVRKSLLSGAEEAEGITVVVDVLRAFTCSALMFNFGLNELYLVRDADKALKLKSSIPNSLAVGEVKGIKYLGYDYGNSPSEIWQAGKSAFENRTAIMRSSAGTQGVVAASKHSAEVILGSYMTAKSIAKYIINHSNNAIVTLVGMGLEAKNKSVEDESCADYIESLISGTSYNHVDAIWSSITDPFIAKSLRGERPHIPREDVILALQRDVFDFVMVADGKDDSGEVVVRKVSI